MINTCKMSQRDQQNVDPKINKQPRIHVLFPPPLSPKLIEFVGNAMFTNFGPFNRVIAPAPLTHNTVPIIFAKLLQLPRFTFSNLYI